MGVLLKFSIWHDTGWEIWIPVVMVPEWETVDSLSASDYEGGWDITVDYVK